MLRDRANWRMKMRRTAWAATVLALPFFAISAVHAQAIMRGPNINIGARAPVISPRVGDIGRNVVINAARGPVVRTPTLTSRLAVRPQFPYLRTSPNLYPACGGASRGADGECIDVLATSNGNGSPPGKGKGKSGGPRRDTVQAAVNRLTIPNEIVAEIEGTQVQADEIARRHGLRRVESENFLLIGATIGLFRITDRRSVDVVSREFASEANVRSVQPNYRYVLQEQKAALSEKDSVQYALEKLHLPEAHALVHGAGIKVAVIDSAIDVRHPELANSIVESFDALGSGEGPHVHGTGIAGAIVAHAKLTGSAPAAQILAIRAFAAGTGGAQSNSYVVLKALNYAVVKGAQVINMSFAGPKDAIIERAIAAVAMHNIVMVAAAGNAGAKSPPLYPAANPNVIAVSATDAQDHLFSASNRGGYIAVAAPGVDVFLPAPDDKYQMTSGTSFSAAYVSGIAALILERNPALKPDDLRAALMKTARDLGSPGRDDLFGAGEADALAAVQTVTTGPAPVANTPAQQNAS
ncbi:MAG: S8 family serine peptidase, partial [Bradyrhizobium sp.]